jgi:ergothioneine biosynthesis protein EgtB
MNPRNLKEEYLIVRNHSEKLCEPLETEDYVPQPVAFVSPPKWHLAHSTWFFETFILQAYKEDYTVFNTEFSFLFNSYYNSVGDRVLRTDRGNITRPTTKKVYDYRHYVDGHMQELLTTLSDDKALDLIQLGLHHEQQHQELLLTDIKYILGHNPLFPAYHPDFNLMESFNPKNAFVHIPDGIYEIGYNGNGFCFDNELGRHKVYLHAFEISNALVTNAEFIEFIEAGGYADFNLWLDEGWTWVNENKIQAPMYWHNIDGVWQYYTLAGLKAVNPQTVLTHISFFEAAAYAQWKGMRLPTEAEWEVASDQLAWGQRWEWTHSAYFPYPNFTKAKGAVGEYNGKFMINTMVLRGASVATPAGHSRATYRNFFHTHERWQYTGLRLVK